MTFKSEGEVLPGKLKHTWDKPTAGPATTHGVPSVGTFGETAVRSTNPSGGYVSPDKLKSNLSKRPYK